MLTISMRPVRPSNAGPVAAPVALVRRGHAPAGLLGGPLGLPLGTGRRTAAPTTRDRGIDLFSATHAWSSSA